MDDYTRGNHLHPLHVHVHLIVLHNKIITGNEAIQWEGFFELALSKVARGHSYTLFQKRKKFFSVRVLDLWNQLDDSTISVDNAFTRMLGTL